MLTLLHLPATGEPAVLQCDPDNIYPVLRDSVGGPVEAVGFPDGHALYLHEEGKLLGLPYNPRATLLTLGLLQPFDVVVGDCVVTGPVDDDGNDSSVSAEYLARFRLAAQAEPKFGPGGSTLLRWDKQETMTGYQTGVIDNDDLARLIGHVREEGGVLTSWTKGEVECFALAPFAVAEPRYTWSVHTGARRAPRPRHTDFDMRPPHSSQKDTLGV